LQTALGQLFAEHPDADATDPNNPSVPAPAIIPILAQFSAAHGGIPLLDPEEQQQLGAITAANPHLRITPDFLMQYVATMTSGMVDFPTSPGDETEMGDRGRSESADDTVVRGKASGSRSSSRDSARTSVFRPENGEAPQTPDNAESDPFQSRQRSTPLGPPTSWKPQANFRRRRSSAGSTGYGSDQEVNELHRDMAVLLRFCQEPSSGRQRAPSTPSSPANYPGKASRSRDVSPGRVDSPPSSLNASAVIVDTTKSIDDLAPNDPANLTAQDLSSASDDESEAEHFLDQSLIRSSNASIASDTSQDRIDTLQRTNQDLMRRVQESERVLHQKVADHEIELEELQAKLDELTEELHATKREEKELRAKEVRCLLSVPATQSDHHSQKNSQKELSSVRYCFD
jgi:hypothetical protein